MAIFTNHNIISAKHKTMAFTGKWRECFGEPSVSGCWIIYGTSGSGKTSFALQLAKYLTNFDRVLYWSREQGNTRTFQDAWKREKMSDCGTGIMVADEDASFDNIEQIMMRRKGCGVLITDSLTALKYYTEQIDGEPVTKQFNVISCERFRKRMKNKLLIWLSHEKNGLPDTNVGDYIMKLSDLKMRVEGFKVMTNSRAGGDMKDFVIWEKGAKEYKGK